uniref:Transmembrane p24 trafficking protein 3 n=1 Tax=Ursus maritimus TaxID=29073 RepID=A0A452U2A5_URSMA
AKFLVVSLSLALQLAKLISVLRLSFVSSLGALRTHPYIPSLSLVITGGHYDVDCYVEDPLGNTIYRETKKQYDSFTHRAEVKGVYQFCFSNEFSTFSHKTVYFDFQVGDEPPILPDMGNRVTALTQMESACVTIHEALKTVIDSQTHYRLREAQDRARAEDLNSRVSYWSVGETVALFVVSLSQVLLLKSFFTEKRASPRALHS